MSEMNPGTGFDESAKKQGLETLRADLDRFWTHALAAFKTAAERSRTGEREKRKDVKKS